MGNKCAPLMLLRLGDSDKVLSDVQELAKAVCAIYCGFPCSRQILGLNPTGKKLSWDWICYFTITKLKYRSYCCKTRAYTDLSLNDEACDIERSYKLIMLIPQVWDKERAIFNRFLPISCPRWTAPPWRRR